jgi:starch-binding outer membrane protein, SusD/RagB family
MTMKSNPARAGVGLALFGALSFTACDYISPTSSNPNSVASATLDQLFTADQVNTFFTSEDQIARFASIWMQQMAGTDRQFSIFDTYVVKEADVSTEFTDRYNGGGLIDLRRAEAQAADPARPVYQGILDVYEAYMMGMTASVWGDIPYSQAADPSITQPALDKQEDVYAAVQAKLDDALSKLATADGGPGGIDVVFGGDADAWMRVAHTLKARYYMHWVEAQQANMPEAATACGGDCLQHALSEAGTGIRSAAGDWRAVHTSAQTETNIWYQFMNDRSGYMRAGAFLVNLLSDRGDPRLGVYYAKNGSGQYAGSEPGENLSSASVLNPAVTGSPTWATPLVTCSENAYIAAEASYDLGDEAGARQWLDDGVSCQEAETSTTLQHPASLSGTDLLKEIMTQKYVAMFLNTETWNDYKRTCLPSLSTYQGKAIPGRLIYGERERQTNSNVPLPSGQPVRNTNDPQPCTST